MVDAVCVGQQLAWKELQDGARIATPPGGQMCDSKRQVHRMVNLPDGMEDHYWPSTTHKDCACNEYAALRNRHLCRDDEVSVTQEGLSAMRMARNRILRDFPGLKPWSYAKVVARAPPHKKKSYQAAVDSLLLDPLERQDGRVRMFIKADKITAEEEKMPRAIQFRNTRFVVDAMRYLKPFEERLYKTNGLGPTETLCVAKGLNQTQRGNTLRTKWDAFADPVALLLDASKWDAHVTIELLDEEHLAYLSKLPSVEFKRILAMQRTNRGYTTNGGIKYRVRGTRMSGDPNTALGNCMINLMILQAWVDRAGVCAELFVDGDDSVIIIERDNLHKLDVSWIQANCGMNMKLELAREFEQIEFCQSRPIKLFDGWRMVRLPNRVLSKSVIAVRSHDGAWGRLAYAVGKCELAMNAGVPVLQEYALALIRAGERTRERGLRNETKAEMRREGLEDLYYRASWQRRSTRAEAVPITVDARLAFEEAFGIDSDQQMLLERQFASWTAEVHPHWVQTGFFPHPSSAEMY